MQRQELVELLSPEGIGLLRSIEYHDKADLVRLVSSLRTKGHSGTLVAAVLTQLKLRNRAVAKFGEFAENMMFTEAGLEQASRLAVAARHAGRFQAAGIKQVADLGCGIGAESIAMAAIGIDVAAYEIDEVTAAVAQYNLNAFENATVNLADVTSIDLSKFEALFFDPARRALGGPNRSKAIRKFDPSEFSPNFDWVLKQATTKPTGIKLGPGHPHEAIPETAEAQWVSVGGDLVELGLWFGAVARPEVKRSALLIRAGESFELKSSETINEHAEIGELGNYLFEPDNAVVRSHLIGLLAQQTQLHSFSPQIAYLTGDHTVESPWLRSFEVVENLPFDRKKLKGYLRERNIGTLEIKKRGSDITPEVLRKELALKGQNSATLIVTRVAGAHRAIICQALK